MNKKLLSMVFAALLFSANAFAQTKNYQLSSHILDINSGKPAAGVKIILSKFDKGNNTWNVVEERFTDENGRVKDFLEENNNNKGIYKLTYNVAPYFESKSQETFYPYIDVVFEIKDDNHYHVPITLSPFGYSTYRGS